MRLAAVALLVMVLAGCSPAMPAAVDHAANATVYAAQSGAEAMRARVLRAAELTEQAPTRTPRPTETATATATEIPTRTPLPTVLDEPTPPMAPPATRTPVPTSTPRPTETSTPAPSSTPAPAPTARVIVPTVVVTVVTIRRDGEPLPDWAVAAVFILMLVCFSAAAWLLLGKYRNGRR